MKISFDFDIAESLKYSVGLFARFSCQPFGDDDSSFATDELFAAESLSDELVSTSVSYIAWLSVILTMCVFEVRYIFIYVDKLYNVYILSWVFVLC